jgi:hypothetical protein
VVFKLKWRIWRQIRLTITLENKAVVTLDVEISSFWIPVLRFLSHVHWRIQFSSKPVLYYVPPACFIAERNWDKVQAKNRKEKSPEDKRKMCWLRQPTIDYRDPYQTRQGTQIKRDKRQSSTMNYLLYQNEENYNSKDITNLYPDNVGSTCVYDPR